MIELSGVMQSLFEGLDLLENFLWGYIGAPIILLLGFYYGIKSRFVQIRKFPVVLKEFHYYMWVRQRNVNGVHPLKVFFACVGGCIGIGNMVGITSAVQLGGPGALFWVWVTAIAGVMLKYAEVYLGVRYRASMPGGGYRGGPMYFLRHAYKGAFFPLLVCFLLAIYGVEIYQFRVVTKSLTHNFGFNEYAVIGVLLSLVLYAVSGGVNRVGEISSATIPLFIFLFVGMGLWIIFLNLGEIPTLLQEVFVSAFTGQAATGGFVGSTIMLAMSQGVRRGAYSGDVGIGYASVIHSETSVTIPEKQASLVIFDIFLDTFVICTMSIVIVLLTGVWQTDIPAERLVQDALSVYFPYMHFFMPFFIFLLGYSTIIAYFVVGLNCAQYLAPKWGKPFYYAYAIAAFITFSFVETRQALSVMAIVGCLLLIINCYGIFRLTKEIRFDFEADELP